MELKIWNYKNRERILLFGLAFFLLLCLMRNFRYNYFELSGFANAYKGSPLYYIRFLIFIPNMIGLIYPQMWFILLGFFAMDFVLLIEYLERSNFSRDRALLGGFLFLLSPPVFYSSQPNYYLGMNMEDSIVLCCVLIALIIYKQNIKKAIILSFLLIPIKETILLLISSIYLIENFDIHKIKISLKNIVHKKYFKLLVVLIAIYIAIRITLNIILETQQGLWESGSFVYIFQNYNTIKQYLFNYIWTLILGFGVLWLAFIPIILKPKYRELLLILLTNFAIIFIIGVIFEINKIWILTPLLYEPFFELLSSKSKT
jgi:hypothetical protein